MDADQIVKLLVTIAVVGFGFATGLASSRGALASLLREPGLLARTALALFVAAPVVVGVLFFGFGIPRAAAIAMILIAVSPGLPLLPIKARRSGGRFDYAVSIT